MLTLYDSLTRKKTAFKPLSQNKIGLYVCGITVYDYCHLGHARVMVCFDMMVRFLRAAGYEVNYVRNITDIDDKIINRALEKNIPIEELTRFFIKAMHEDASCLNVLPPDQEPCATHHIADIIELIQTLIEKGHAYVNAQGDVCYEVNTFKDYGKLAHKDLEGLMAGARVEVVKEKKSPLDFVLWKKAKPKEPSWDSPWGQGRPGWHIECSAMSMSKLGNSFDIHGGGFDLQFPHHENEIAQSEGASNEPLANYWLHVGLLQINQEKMAKSLGNFLTIRATLETYHPEVLRYFLLSSHYRSALNFSKDQLIQAEKSLERLYAALQWMKALDNKEECQPELLWVERFNAAMNDDFNTPEAFAVLFQLSREANKNRSPTLAFTLYYLGSVLGLLQNDPQAFLKRLETKLSAEENKWIETLIQERLEARAEKNWPKADDIRNQLADKGIELEDGPGPTTTWKKKSTD